VKRIIVRIVEDTFLLGIAICLIGTLLIIAMAWVAGHIAIGL
jgi:hypothetical protein